MLLLLLRSLLLLLILLISLDALAGANGGIPPIDDIPVIGVSGLPL